MKILSDREILGENIKTLRAAEKVLKESYDRVGKIFQKDLSQEISIEERESCEALTARFARLCDYLFHKAFRTIDVVELTDEGSPIDRLNRMEKRSIISSTAKWRLLKNLRNEIAHDYVIEKNDRILKEAFANCHELFETVERYEGYLKAKGFS